MTRLNRIELENFKSYHGIQTIGPFSHFTAIIGPNGSGKSNLMDAISFVLGIKSTQLRSFQLQDLIYSTNIPPNPTFARVSAVLLHDDNSETIYSRSISLNSNSSQYSINNSIVPWADYNHALEQENILVKAKNFLVFQGDVEAIASQSPKELTKLIEQISGSLDLKPEYENLKLVQEKATENSTLFFNKKKSVTAEMKHFKEQKEEAQRFNQLLAKKINATLTFAIWNLFCIDENMNQFNSEINNSKRIINDYKIKKNEVETSYNSAKGSQATLNKEIIKLESKLKIMSQKKNDKRPQFLKLDETIKHSSKKLKTAIENIKDAKLNRDNQARNIAELEKELSILKKTQKKFNENVKKDAASGPELSESDIAEFNKRKLQVEEQTISLKEKIHTIEREVQSAKDVKIRMEEKIIIQKNKYRTLNEELVTASKKREKLEYDIQNLKAEIKAEKRKVQESNDEKSRLTQLEKELGEKITETNARLLQANADKSSSEREKKFKETLNSIRRLFPGVYGRIIDLCKPTHKKYDLAVSIILGRNLDAIVVDNEKTAVECIRYMREQRSGQATFLPLDTIKTKPVNEKYRNFEKGARLAVDVIDSETNIEAALQFACGNALICETSEIAQHICYERKQEVKAVALDGTVIHKTGMITGGQSSSGTSRRWEEKEVDDLKKGREALYTQIQDITKSLRKLGHNDQLLFDVTDHESRLNALINELESCNIKIKSIETEKSHIEREIGVLNQDLSISKSAIETSDKSIAELDSQIISVENSIFKDFCSRLDIKNIRSYERNQMSVNQETREKKNQYEIAIARFENQLLFERQSLKDCLARIDKLKSDAEKEKDIISINEASKAEFLDAQNVLENEILQKDKDLQNLQNDLKNSIEELNKLKKQLELHNSEIQEKMKTVFTKESEIERLVEEKVSLLRKCKLEEIDIPLLHGKKFADLSIEDLESLKENEMEIEDRLHIGNIDINYSHLKKELRKNLSPETEAKLSEEISQISEEIEKIASHVQDVDKLQEAESKYKKTTEEFENSRKSAKDAKELFTAVRNERYKRFYSAYSHISDQIDRIYKELTMSKAFPLGGTAYLSLEDSEEPYLDGIKYHAMPPMKRFREMELLSGGEKTVAALALLFAIHSYQPSPFFVLDEVDAALDNTNVSKIANYIRNHASNQFQFIVISLKNTFYENADSLVGVYKDVETNCSRVLTMDISNFEE